MIAAGCVLAEGEVSMYVGEEGSGSVLAAPCHDMEVVNGSVTIVAEGDNQPHSFLLMVVLSVVVILSWGVS